MDSRLTEDQQVQQIKALWNNYGRLVVIAVVVVAALSFAWRGWQQHQDRLRVQASMAYEQLLSAVGNNDENSLEAQGEHLTKEYPATIYAALAALFLAHQDVYAHKLTEASTHLNWVIENTSFQDLRDIAKLRLARLLLAQSKGAEAIALLEQIKNNSFKSLADEVRGDCYLALGHQSDALAAYQQAVDSQPGALYSRPLLRMKLEDLAKPNNVAVHQGNATT